MTMSTPTTSSPKAACGADIHLDGIRFAYEGEEQSVVLDGLTATFPRDRMTLITGPSGSGKSTLLYLVAGIYPSHAGALLHGAVSVEGYDPAKLTPPDRASLVGMVFQNPSLQFCMDTVENELLFCLGNVRVPRERMPEKVQDALGFCDIGHLRHRTLRTLSGGEKQLVALACIVALDPAWLLLDEPFANVDEEAARILVRKVEALHQRGMGVLVVDHRVDYWNGVVDDVWILDGRRGALNPDRMSHDDERRFQRLADGSSKGDIELAPVRLELRGVTIRRGERIVLDDVTYAFRAGGIYAISGTSGSGKSSLFDALLGVVPYNGNVLLDGRALHRYRRISPGTIGFVTQNPHDQFVTNTVYEEIATSLVRGRQSRLDIEQRVEQVLTPLGLWEYRNVSPFRLSQGQQRRLAVAALLAYDCRVLVCDEPTYAQDDDNARAIMDALVDIVRQRGVTLIFSTHDLHLARGVADIVLTLAEGTIREVD